MLQWVFFFFALLLSLPAHSQSATNEEEFEDIYVYLRIERVGAYEISAIYSYENERLYLPVADLFRVLQINHQANHFFDTISGFFLDEKARYLIDYPGRKIEFNNRTISLTDDDILHNLNGIYLYVGLFGPVFGLHAGKFTKFYSFIAFVTVAG